jgi:carbon monoxide dehydrogenase subunit G
MELEHSFTVPVPEERAWEVLMDVNRVAPCMPGASLDSVEGDDIKGRIKVKVGPIAMTYAGTAHFTERDEQNHVIVLEASGKETRGAGTASATVRSTLQEQGDQTHVVVNTTLNVTGRPAQFGRGVMAEVGGKLIGIFAANLADMLSAEPAAQPAAEPAESSAESPAGEQEGDLSQTLESLNLPVRTYNGLRRTGIHTVDDLASQTREKLLGIEGIGPASVEEIRQKLADRGLTLKDSPVSGNGIAGSAAVKHPPTVPSAVAAQPAAEAPRPMAATAGNVEGPSDDDAIDLLSVAGAPILKRAIPVAAAIAAATVIVLRIRIKRRKARG